MEDTLFIEIDGKSYFLGIRNLPVYIRKRYSRTNQEVKGQKRRKKKTGTLDKWLPRLYPEKNQLEKNKCLKKKTPEKL